MCCAIALFTLLFLCVLIFFALWIIFKNLSDIRKTIVGIFNQIPKDIFRMSGFREGLWNYSGIAASTAGDHNLFSYLKPNTLREVLNRATSGFGYTNTSGHFTNYIQDLQHSLLCDFNNYTAKYLTELIQRSSGKITPEIERFLETVKNQESLLSLSKHQDKLAGKFGTIAIILVAIFIVTLIITLCVAVGPSACLKGCCEGTSSALNRY